MLFTLICASHSGSFPFVTSYPFHSSHFRRVTTYQRLLQFPQTKQIRRSNPLALPRVSNLVWPKTLSTKTEKAGENPQQRQRRTKGQPWRMQTMRLSVYMQLTNTWRSSSNTRSLMPELAHICDLKLMHQTR